MNKLIKQIMTAAIGLTMIAGSAYADLGWKPKQAVSNYGQPVKTGVEKDGRKWGDFKSNGYYVTLWFLNGTVSRAAYARLDGNTFSEGEVRAFLNGNVPEGTQWGESYSDAQSNGHIDSTDGRYFSMLSADEKVVAVWTKADNNVVLQNQKKGNQNQGEQQNQLNQDNPKQEQQQEQPDETN
jgi:hypothetical protein